MRKFEPEEVKAFIESTSPETSLYIGCDSYRFKKDGVWYARYSSVCVIHIDSKHGCRVYGLIDTERDYDQKKDKPKMRMMNEVYRAVQMYQQIADVVGDRRLEIHVDINKDPKHGSHVAYSEALGYVKGMTGLTAIVKPESPAASFCADHFREYKKEVV